LSLPNHFRIDADFHLPQAALAELLPFLDEYWQMQVTDRELVTMPFRLSSYPASSPLTRNSHFDGVDVARRRGPA
jgi:uncharacterized protein